MRLTKTLVLCSASAAILSAAGSPVWAQTSPQTAPVQAQEEPSSPEAAAPQQDDAAEDDNEVEGVVVTGLRRSLQSAQSIRRNSDQIVDAIVAEDIGKLPDVTAAESLARITGVQVLRRAGEAEQVLVRGLPDLATTYNGRDIFTAEARFVAVQDFPAGGVAALEVYKSTTANLIEGGIAGLINVRSRRPFDFSDSEVAGSINLTYANQSKSIDGNGNLLLSDRWQTGAGEFGALLNLSYTQLHFLDSARFDAGVGEFGNPATTGFRAPNGVGIFQAEGRRARPSFNAALQWRPSANLEIYFDALYQGFRNRGSDRLLFAGLGGGTFSNVVLRGKNEIGQNEAQSLTVTGANRPDGFQGAANGDTDTYQFGIGAVYNMGAWRFSTDLATTDSVFELTVYGFDFAFAGPVTFDANFNAGEDGGASFNFRNFDSTNPANYIFRGFYDRRLVAAGDDIQWRGDARYDTGWDLIPQLEFGLRYADRNGTFDEGDRYAFREPSRIPLDVTPVDLELNPAGFEGSDVSVPRFVVGSRQSIRDRGGDLRAFVGFAEGHPPFFAERSFVADEKSYAGYGQLDYEIGGGIPIDGVIGLRVVKTQFTISGTTLTDTGAGLVFTPTTRESEYTDYLPSISARIRFTEALQARLAANKTRTRPSFSQLNPSLRISPNVDPSVGLRRADGGNIELRPIEAENYDAALEYYFSPTGSASVTIFRRDIDGFIVNQGAAVSDPQFGTFFITRPVNLNAERLEGLEAQLTTFFDFDFVPLWARGFGLQANYTLIDSELPGVSETSYNLVGMFEQGPLSARLAYNFRGEFESLDPREPGLRVSDRGRLDFSASYTPVENITIAFDASNITGEPFKNTSDYGPGVYPRDVRYEETIYSVGLRFRRQTKGAARGGRPSSPGGLRLLNQVHHVDDDCLHGGMRGCGVAPLYRLQHGVVRRQAGAAAHQPVGEPDGGPERGGHHVPELYVEGVGRRLQDGDVEVDVGVQRIVGASLGLRHALIARADASEVLRVRRLCRQGRGGRLDGDAQLAELTQQVDGEAPLEQPAQHIGIEQVPGRGGLHHGPLPGTRGEQALGGQHLDRLAGDRAADAVLPGELGFRGEGPALVAARDDGPAHLVEQPIGEIAPERAAALGRGAFVPALHRRGASDPHWSRESGYREGGSPLARAGRRKLDSAVSLINSASATPCWHTGRRPQRTAASGPGGVTGRHADATGDHRYRRSGDLRDRHIRAGPVGLPGQGRREEGRHRLLPGLEVAALVGHRRLADRGQHLRRADRRHVGFRVRHRPRHRVL